MLGGQVAWLIISTYTYLRSFQRRRSGFVADKPTPTLYLLRLSPKNGLLFYSPGLKYLALLGCNGNRGIFGSRDQNKPHYLCYPMQFEGLFGFLVMFEKNLLTKVGGYFRKKLNNSPV